jgi:multiple sugar transport system substrate-binding protein
VALVEAYAPRWTSRTGGRVRAVAWEPGRPPPDDADVLLMEPAEMPAHAAHLKRVPATLTTGDGYDWNQLLPVFRTKLLIWTGEPKALPLLGDAPLCFYRTDLLGNAAPPTTWDDFVELAEKFSDPARPSLPPLPERDDELDREFFGTAAPLVRRSQRESDPRSDDRETFSFHFDVTTMKPLIATDGFVAALTLMQRLQKQRPKGTGDPAAAFARGEAALCVAEAKRMDEFRRGKVAGKFGVCRLPGSRAVYRFDGGRDNLAEPNFVSYLGAAGWLAAVPESSQKGDAAWDLLAELTGPTTSRQIVSEPRWGGGATRREQLDGVNGFLSFGLSPAQTDVLVRDLRQTVMHPGVRNPVLRLRIPGQREYQKALLTEVRLALLEGKDARKALGDAAARWDELAARDPAGLKRDYYLSLSLEPPR